MGTIGVPDSLPRPNTSREKPAPATTRSMPSLIAVFTTRANSRAATMMLMPMTPFVKERASRIS